MGLLACPERYAGGIGEEGAQELRNGLHVWLRVFNLEQSTMKQRAILTRDYWLGTRLGGTRLGRGELWM